MRTVRLKTGVIVTFNDKDEMQSVSSPYLKDEPFKKTFTNRIKQIFKN